MKKLYNKTYILFMGIILIVVLFSIPSYYIYKVSSQALIDRLSADARNISIIISDLIAQNEDDFIELTEEGTNDQQKKEDYYSKIQLLIDKYQKEMNINAIYIKVRGSDMQAFYIFGGSEDDIPPDPQKREASMTQIENNVFEKGAPVNRGLYYNPDRGRNVVSGFAPILDKEGSVIGMVGVDFSLLPINDMLLKMRCFIIINAILLILITTLLAKKLWAKIITSNQRDYLTGLYSRHYYEYQLARIIKESKKENKTFTFVIIDIDNFKLVNDQYGHLMGDKVLKTVAQIIQMNLGNEDICSRYGGDEFVAILWEAEKERVMSIIEKIRNEVNSHDFTGEGDVTFRVSLSAGLTLWNSEMNKEILVGQADKALYFTKNAGKNNISIYDASMQ